MNTEEQHVALHKQMQGKKTKAIPRLCLATCAQLYECPQEHPWPKF